jgi:hypothetical protein
MRAPKNKTALYHQSMAAESTLYANDLNCAQGNYRVRLDARAEPDLLLEHTFVS